MVSGLFFCATLTDRRGDRNPFVQAGAELSDTGAKADKPDPHCSSKNHSGRVGVGVGDESVKSGRVIQPFCIPLMIRPERRTSITVLLSDELMSCCATAAGKNGCLVLRHGALALGGPVSAEWSRSSGSMARRIRENVTPLQRSSAAWMSARIGRLSSGVRRRHSVTIHKASLMAGTTRRV